MPDLKFKSITSDPDWTQITVEGPFDLGVMEVQFKTLKNNKPNANNNYLAIWEGSGNPWTDKKLRCEAINCVPDMNKGDWAFTYKLKYQQEYVLGYCVSSDGMDDKAEAGETRATGLCALAHIPEEGNEVTYEHTSMELIQVRSNSLSLKYKMLEDYDPKSCLNWIGIFSGDANIYTSEPKWAVPVLSGRSSDSVVFNGITIERGTRYQLAYYMNGWTDEQDKSKLVKTAAACRLVFETE